MTHYSFQCHVSDHKTIVNDTEIVIEGVATSPWPFAPFYNHTVELFGKTLVMM